MNITSRFLVVGALLLSACGPAATNNTPNSTNPTSTQGSLIVQTLTPICADVVKEQDVIPQLAKDAGITEQQVCECGLRRTETKLRAEPQILTTILTDRDQQIEILTELGAECAQELLQQAVRNSLNPGS